jgi:lysophospholipid acyltransferase
MGPLEMEPMAAAIGVSVPVLRFLLCFAATIPTGLLWRAVPSAAGRHLYAGLSGAALSYLSFGDTSNLLFVGPMAFGYLAMLLCRRRAGLVTFLGAFGFLIAW